MNLFRGGLESLRLAFSVFALFPLVTHNARAQSEFTALNGFLGRLLDSPLVQSVNAYQTISAPFSNRDHARQEERDYQLVRTIADNQQKILERFDTLGFILRSELRKNFLHEAVERLRGEIFAHDVLRSMPPSPERGAEANRIARDVSQVAAEIASYNNVSVIPAYLSSLSELSLIYRGGTADPLLFKAALSPHYNNLASYLDPSIVTSVAGERRLLVQRLDMVGSLIGTKRSFLIGRLEIGIKAASKSYLMMSNLFLDYQSPTDGSTPDLAPRITFNALSETTANLSVTKYFPNASPQSDIAEVACLSGLPTSTFSIEADTRLALNFSPQAEKSVIDKRACLASYYGKFAKEVADGKQHLTQLTSTIAALTRARMVLLAQLELDPTNLVPARN